ncbi:helix-turn-helix domain-containing protein [Streptomyces sp. NBC_01537]|uniref:helix-turn-helix domain-containing protein n=1 Tax=Streptomyces sp. NBC_01537 TaxID=2903896 RepID=UPI00386A2F6E
MLEAGYFRAIRVTAVGCRQKTRLLPEPILRSLPTNSRIPRSTLGGGSDHCHAGASRWATLFDVPQGDKRKRSPVEYGLHGVWPHAVLDDHHGARVAQELAARLRAAIDKHGWSIAELSRRSNVARLTIMKVLGGEVWCDLLTIANLERALNVDLWPGRGPDNPPQ